VGEVTEIRGRKLQIISGSLKMNIDISKTEPVDAGEYRKGMSGSRPQPKIDWSLTTKRNQFNPEIDVRGMRAEEALRVVQEFIDTALMIQFRSLRILHGKGNGILRQMIRQYLESTGAVRSTTDEHVDRGGAGITLVELYI
jgi:DNA mismatch repair protein MutS2